ncbi:MAG: lipopolysaccharide biosynthesis protein [Marinifilaceae bacterium]
MAGIKSLMKDTALYGISSILGRFLNWWLVPLYTRRLDPEEFGNVSNLYGWMALLLILLTYGLETGFFRFASNPEKGDSRTIFSTCLVSLLSTSTLFFGAVMLLLTPISSAMGYANHTDYIAMIALIIALDAFTSLPFAYLRYERRALRFVVIKLASIGIMIALNLFFFIVAPLIHQGNPNLISWFYNPDYGVSYILVSNVISSLFVLVAFIPELTRFKWHFDAKLLGRILRYSAPLLILGLAGIMNQTIDKIIIPMIIKDKEAAFSMLGIYNANFKIAVIMVMFLQAFRYAYEPFIFSQSQSEDKKDTYAIVMKYFVLFGLLIFLGVNFYIDILRHFIDAKYYSGLRVVPIVMLAELFFGVFFNLSLWYKLTDKTYWGTYFSLIGLAITLTINILFIPVYGFMACAWAAFCCYGAMMLISYFVGQRYFPIRYDLKSIAGYSVLAGILYGIASMVTIDNMAWRLVFRTGLIMIYCITVFYTDHMLKVQFNKIKSFIVKR